MTYRAKTTSSSLGCACGVRGLGASYPLEGLGAVTVGEIGGIAALEHDIRLTNAAMRRQWGSFTFSPATFDALMARAGRGELTQMTPTEAKQFVLGIVNRVTTLVVHARLLAQKTVPDAAARERIQSAQANLLRSGRDLWMKAQDALRTARPASGTSGLGIIPILVVGGVLLILALAGGGTYIASQYIESTRALDEAQRLCREYPTPPCTPERVAELARRMRGDDPVTVLADRLGTPVGIGLGVAGGILLLGGGVWLWQKTRRRRVTYVE